MNNKFKFNNGDECYCDFELNKIKSIEGDRVTSVSDGFINMSSHDLDCFPVTLKNKEISDQLRFLL
jgi:hypothetical protein